jgi:hypothetical protein
MACGTSQVAAICTKSVTPFHCGCKNIVWANFMTVKLKNNSFKQIHAKYYHCFNSAHDRENQSICSPKMQYKTKNQTRHIWTKVYNKAATVDFEYNVIAIGLW